MFVEADEVTSLQATSPIQASVGGGGTPIIVLIGLGVVAYLLTFAFGNKKK